MDTNARVDVVAQGQEGTEHGVREVSELQLALVGGGCAEICPY